ncbi:MAG TPA: nucleotidyltransferase domain-containing protein [Alphaproteobacteria bacterium]|nr:nucleotidyltransferase domain-containing protein [Alphaproteobacteria bacterium]
MDFNLDTRKNVNLSRYHKDDLDIVYSFSKEVKKELGMLLKGIILFGSTARNLHSNKKSNDIDILLILDDVTVKFTPELIQTYRIIVEKVVLKVSKKLHITSLKLTNFWEYVRAGDPIAVNMLRDGIPIIDTGFFEPLQILLYQGRIRPSPESIQNYMLLAPQTLQNSRAHILQATLDLYWAVIDAAHASLMYVGEVPPSPSHVAELMDEKLVKPGLLDKKHLHTVRMFYNLSKSITHGQLHDLTGAHYDGYYREAYDFVMAVKKFINKR